jgi:hypothetical protein
MCYIQMRGGLINLKKFLTGFILFILLAASVGIDNASAHSGRTDRLGGHFRTSNCTYMFHHPTSAVTGKTKQQIVNLIIRYNSNYRCTSSLTANKVDWSTVRHR